MPLASRQPTHCPALPSTGAARLPLGLQLRDALLEVKQQLEAARAEKEQLLTATQVSM